MRDTGTSIPTLFNPPAVKALAGLDGGLRHHVEVMRTKCIHLLARVDAHIDYEDEMEPLNTDEIHKMCLDLKVSALPRSLSPPPDPSRPRPSSLRDLAR